MGDSLKDLLRVAILDPGSTPAGRKLGPSWGRGQDGYAREEETLPQWQVRAVMAALDQAGALLPDDGRMATYRPAANGRSREMIIRIDGPREIFRFAVNMLTQQCDIYAAGRRILVALRDDMTPELFDPMAVMMLGQDRYEKLRGDFLRNFSCVGCEKNIRVGARYAPTDDAGAVCATCCKGHPDYVARLVKRQPDPALAAAAA